GGRDLPHPRRDDRAERAARGRHRSRRGGLRLVPARLGSRARDALRRGQARGARVPRRARSRGGAAPHLQPLLDPDLREPKFGRDDQLRSLPRRSHRGVRRSPRAEGQLRHRRLLRDRRHPGRHATPQHLALMPRALVLGLDCAPPALVFDRFAGVMPCLSRLRREGAFGRLRSTEPPITMPAWASMAAGRDPGELGLYGFRNRGEGYALTISTARDVKFKRVWDYVGEAGKKVAALYVPPSYPPPPVRGVSLGCFLTPD